MSWDRNKPNHWQHDAGGFYCDLDPDKSRQSPITECRFCRQAEKEELLQLRQTVKSQEEYISELEDMIAKSILGEADLSKGEPF